MVDYAGVLILSVLPGAVLADENPEAQAGEVIITVDGQSVQASEGMVVAQGVKEADGDCELGRVQLRGHVSRSLPTGSVSVSVNESCQLIVKDIRFSTTSQESPSPPKHGDIEIGRAHV